MNTNYESGFPQFYFPSIFSFQIRNSQYEDLEYIEYHAKDLIPNISSWYIYYKYIQYLENYKIFFSLDNYFKNKAMFYIENCGVNYHVILNEMPLRVIPGIASKIIGNLNFEKINYFIKYSAIYNEDQLSKLSNISVNPIK